MSILAKWLSEHEMTEEAFASVVGISQSHINRIKNGKLKPSSDYAVRLEAATGIPAWDFIKPRQEA